MSYYIYHNPRLERAREKYKELKLLSLKEMKEAELVVVLGGDGSLLKLVPDLIRENKPVLFFPCGEKSGIPGFSRLRKRDIRNWKKLMLIEAAYNKNTLLALNDIVLRSGRTARVFRSGIEWGRVNYDLNGDGLVVATPVGSMAYNFALGGPVVDKDLELFVINPIASFHSFSHSLVVGSDHIISIKVSPTQVDLYLWADGQRHLKVETPAEIKIQKSQKYLEIVLPE